MKFLFFSLALITQINLFAQKEMALKHNVALVYPDKLPEKRNELVAFYDSFIRAILDGSDINELTIIHRSGLKEKLLKLFPSSKVKLIESNSVQDIWIRDFAPIYINQERVFKALYNPSYFQEDDKKTQYADEEKTIFYYASLDEKAGVELAKELQINVTNLTCNNQRIILDGGNFIHNGNGIAVTTNRIIADNESLSIEEIRKTFKDQLEISKLIIVPVEPGDETGHVDGMIRFIDEKTVVVAKYPDNYKNGPNNITEKDYLIGKQFLDQLADSLNLKFTVIRIENSIPKNSGENEFPSAFGNYINYLRIGDKIFLPQYGNIEMDKSAKMTYEKYFKVIPIKTGIEKLASLGGVLNCITWNY